MWNYSTPKIITEDLKILNRGFRVKFQELSGPIINLEVICIIIIMHEEVSKEVFYFPLQS